MFLHRRRWTSLGRALLGGALGIFFSILVEDLLTICRWLFNLLTKVTIFSFITFHIIKILVWYTKTNIIFFVVYFRFMGEFLWQHWKDSSITRKIISSRALFFFLDSSSVLCVVSCNNSLNIFVQISIFFDILFMFQHYVLYPEKKSPKSPETGEESNEPLIDPSHEHV